MQSFDFSIKAFLCAVLVICFSATNAQDAKYYNGKADEFSNNGEYDLAITNYTSAIRIDPANAYAYNGRGFVYGSKNQMDLAIQDFTRAINADPEFFMAYDNRGYAYSQMNKLDLAMQDFNTAISLNPDFDRAYSNRGEVYFKMKQFDFAIKDHTKAISLEAEYPPYYYARGLAYANKNQLDLAIQDFTKAITLGSNYPLAYGNRGYAYSQKKQFDLAIQDYTVAISQDPNYSFAYANRGYAYSQKNQFDLAIQDYTVAISQDPNYSFAYSNRGYAYLQKKQFELAIQDYTTNISFNPGYAINYANRGYAYAQTNQLDLAIQDYGKALDLDSNNSRTYSGRGWVYLRKRQFDLAIQDYSKAIRLEPGNASFYGSRYSAYYNINQMDLALQDISKAISTDPSTVYYYNNRGFYYNAQGKYDLAIQDFKTCLTKDPNYNLAYINIISPLVRMQRFAEAKSYYDLYGQKKLSSYLETDRYKFYKKFIIAVTQVADGKLNDALTNLDLASNEYGTEIKEETKRSFIDILFLKGYILEKIEQAEEAKSIYEQSLVIDSKQPDIKEALQNLEQKQTQSRSIDNTPPEITLISPAPSRSFDIEADNSKTQIIGKAKDAAGIASIKINTISVDKIEDDGLFITNLVLKSGTNSIEIVATDKQGNTAKKTFTINGTAGANNPAPKADMVAAPGAGGPKYYAILIAEKDYDDPAIPDLQNPVKDAKELKIILESKYTFDPANIDTLYNRSREDIMQAIVLRCNSLTENDNLIIFYAGHGIAEKDKFGDVDGYWIPSSAKKGLTASYISSDEINKAIKRSDAKHILLIADACFSGSFTRQLSADAPKEVTKQYALSSRKVMASGNIEPVPDNSKFIFYIKQRLNDNKEKYLTAKDLFDSFYKAILNNTDNVPQYAAVKNAGDEGGEFIFIKK